MPKIVDFMFDEDTYKLLREAYRNGKTHAKPIDFKKLPKIIISLDGDTEDETDRR